MSKIAQYLQEHIHGEVSTQSAILSAMSVDASLLEITPELVVYPRTTNDIRKVARFAWQLAEKGHVLPVTARGGGSDQTGAAIGRGLILAVSAHMNRVLEFDSKQKLIRVQPGLNAQSLNDTLQLHGMAVPALPISSTYSTVGGAIANNASSPLSGKYGDMSAWVHQLEVVLANGDILQTERISKRDLNKKKGMQTFEGELYRSLDNLIEDNKKMIDEKLGSTIRDNAGYCAIAKVKHKDGSFDLTPLIAGSQGTLGVISEVIMKTDFFSANKSVIAASFRDQETARDALDQLRAFDPSILEYFDGTLFTDAAQRGKLYDLHKSLDGVIGAVILIGFDEFSDHARKRKMRRVTKLLSAMSVPMASAEGNDVHELLALREVTAYSLSPAEKEVTAPPLFDGAYVPRVRFEDFQSAVTALAKKHAVPLPLHSRALEDLHYARPVLHLKKVGDKQKVFKLLDEYAHLVAQHGGHLIGEAGEGRLKARFAYAQLDDDVLELFAAIKAIFDPYSIMNPGVKQPVELKDLVTELNPGYSIAPLSQFSPYN